MTTDRDEWGQWGQWGARAGSMALRLFLMPLLMPLLTLLLMALPMAMLPAAAAEPQPVDARQLVADAIDQTRGLSSYAEMEMEIHRPDWTRTSSIVAWTRGREDALIRFTAPPRDAGNATLKEGEQMWTFTPRLNRVVRLPYSMMSQSWAGSDFSYNDLSRTDALLRHYQHRLLDTREADGLRIYTIESVPNADAPVVWGRQVLVMREDNVLLEETFFDQDGVALKRMETLEVGELGGRTIPVRMRMARLDEEEHWTEVRYRAADFDLPIDDRRFTLYALRNPER
ncbi:MAG TPA: outer membrane lipoprotein-sorting protein [Pseudomonadales bacterium]|nr:outer membrane lipoprotein-sorting protein [Pseudomonadales bacterium]